MRRWLLFVAIAALPGVSRADLVLYGKIYAEVAQETQGSGATRIDKTTLDDAQNTGRFGLRFSQDLENGLQAFGKYEFQLGTTNSGDNFEPRETYVGLKGRFGSFALGQFEGAYKITGGAEFDPFFGTSLEARGNGGMSSSAYGTSNFINHAVQYQSPSLDVTGDWKFTTTVQYGVDSTPGVADA
ncbi:MAG: porin, partial [Gammaproteobacteria bacterium]